MSVISALPTGVVAWLSQQEALSNIRFMTEYPSEKKAIPLRNAIVAIGLEEVKIEDSFTEDGNGVLVENEYCRLATMKIKLAIHIPFSEGGAKCHDVFSSVVDYLTFASDLQIVESGCYEVIADRDTDAFVLNAWINVSADFCPAVSSGQNFQSFVSKDLLCGGHIMDSVIHVTQEDKALWNEPFVANCYTGLGTSSRTISTQGFTPKVVIVFKENASPAVPSWPNLIAHVGIAYRYSSDVAFGSLGIEIINGGFRVHQGSADGQNNVANLNENGCRYGFVAFK